MLPRNIDYKIIEHSPNRSSLVIFLPGERKTPKVAFLGHLDTVPVEDEKEWRYPPFSAAVENGHMYGRGTVDMKGGLAAMILIILYFVEGKMKPPADLLFVFTAGEEADGLGIRAVKGRRAI
ncbi:MAG TPA: M20/M25/M40 family metallo-hydrolase [Moorella mulderi]|nr:M20/M25/M40 family metallo-hydrolase [Moorella mulderi]